MDTTTPKKRKAKLFKDQEGREVPAKFVRKSEQLKDKETNRLFAKAIKLEAAIREFKEDVFKTGEKVNKVIREDYQLKDRENSRGGFSLNTIDKSCKIEFKIGTRITFDDRIDLAKEKLYEFTDENIKGSTPGFRQFVTAAFETTKGKLDPSRVMNLFSYKIDDPLWKEAIEILRDSITTQVTKRYVNFSKKDEEGKFVNLILDFNAL